MARSFIYSRPLDVKILPDSESSNHVFQFDTSLEIKKEVESDPLNTETEQFVEPSIADSDGIDNNHDSEQSTITSEQQFEKNNDAPRSKLVIKFSDLLKKSKQSCDSIQKTKKRKHIDSVPIDWEIENNKKSKIELSCSMQGFTTRASSKNINSTETDKQDEKSKLNILQQENTDISEKNLNYTCDSCGQCFTSKKTCTNHIRYYSNGGDHHCTICDLRYSRRYLLLRHNKSVHSEPEISDIYRFKCNVCIERFEKYSSLIAHIKHLHNEHIPSEEKNENTIKNEVSWSMASEKMKKKVIVKKLESLTKQHSTIATEDREILQNENSNFSNDLDPSAEIITNKDKQFITKSCGSKEHDKIPNSKSTESNLALNDNKIHQNSSSQINIQIPVSAELEEEQTTVTRRTRSSIEDSRCNSFKRKITQEISNEDKLSLNKRTCKKKRTVPKLQEHTEQRNQMLRRSQTGFRVGCGNVRRTRKKEIDYVKDTDDKPDVFELARQRNRFSRCSNGIEGGTNDKISELEIYKANSKNSNFKTITLMRPCKNVTGNKESLKKGECTDCMDDNKCITCKVQQHLDKMSNKKKLLTQDQRSDQQISMTLQNEGLEEVVTPRMITNNFDNNVPLSCNNVDINLSETINFGERSGSVVKNNNKAEKTRDGIKEVRISLMRLENISNQLAGGNNSFSKSIINENSNLSQINNIDCYICEKEFANKAEIWRYFVCRNNEECKYVKKLKLINDSEKSESTINYCQKEFPKNDTRVKKQESSKTLIATQKHCFFCNEIFQNKHSLLSHYITIHTKPGSTCCCLCNSYTNNLLKLRFHLLKHFHNPVNENSIKLCLNCKKRMNSFSFKSRCLDCMKKYREQKTNHIREIQFVKKYADIFTPQDYEVLENRLPSSHENSSVKILEDKSDSNSLIFDNKLMQKDTIINSHRTNKEISKNFKCSFCNRIFFKNKSLKFHLLIAHVSVKQWKYKKCKNLKNKNMVPKFGVGLKKMFNHKYIFLHDRFCKKILNEQRQFKFFATNSSKKKNHHRRSGIQNNARKWENYRCNVCKLNCCCRKSLKIHSKRYATNGNNSCNICGLTYAWKRILVTHMKRAHNPKNLYCGRIHCEICNQGFYNRKFLRIHLAHFHNIKYYQCKICKIRFDSNKKLNNHVRYYKETVNYSCSICNEKFKCKHILNYHKAQVHNRQKLKAYKYSCDVCNCAFLNELLLQAHIRHFHAVDDNETKLVKSNKNVDDKIDGEEKQNFENLGILMKNENICDLTIEKEDASSIQEIIQQTKDKTILTYNSNEYKCDICKLKFTDPNAILNHEWEYLNEGTYSCDVCNRKFMTNLHLKNHKIKHYQRNAIRKYECRICKEEFYREDQLKMHGLHLHGPQYALENNLEINDILNLNISNYREKSESDDDLGKLSINGTCNTFGLMTSIENCQTGRILFFHKVSNNKSQMEMLRRNSNDDGHCCEFCEASFSSLIILKDHMKKHSYHAYCYNSSKYRCLICKDKFRTNDILRAHVIHFHATEQTKPISIESVSSNVSFTIHPNIFDESCGKNEQNNLTNNESLKFNSDNICNNLQQSNIFLSEQKKELFIDTNDVNILENDHTDEISSIPDSEVLISFLPSDDNDANKSQSTILSLRSVQSCYSENSSCVKLESISSNVNAFIMEAKDIKGLKKYTCIICIKIFDSVSLFEEHFNSLHVKDESYLCTICNKQFNHMLDLKCHVLKHKGDPKYYICCEKKFQQIEDLVNHKLLHVEENKIDNQYKFAKKELINTSNINETTDQCTCDNCNEIFPNLKSLLKHWNSCVDKDCFKCDLCGSMIKKQLLMVHKISCQKNENRNDTLNNRSNLQLNKDETITIYADDSAYESNNIIGETIVSKSIDMTDLKNIERLFNSSDQLFDQNQLPKIGKIKVKPFAKIAENLKNHQASDAIEQKQQQQKRKRKQRKQQQIQKQQKEQQQKDNINEKVESQSISSLHKNVMKSFEQRSVNEIIEAGKIKKNQPIPKIDLNSLLADFPCSVKSVQQANESNEKNFNNLCNGNDNLLENRSIQDSDDISIQNLVPNNFIPEFRVNECTEKVQPSLNLDILNTIQDSSTSNIKHPTVKSNQIIYINNYENRKSIKQTPISSNIKSPEFYYVEIPAPTNSTDNIDNTVTIENNSCRNLNQTNNCGKKKSSKSRSKSSNREGNLTRSPSVEIIFDNLLKNNNETVIKNKSNQKFRKKEFTDGKSRSLNSSNLTNDKNNSDIIQQTSNDSIDVGNKNIITIDERQFSKNENENFLCIHCEACFKEKEELVNHMKSHRINNQCTVCGLTFSNERALQLHLPEHKYSTCTKCNTEVFFNDDLADSPEIQRYCSSCNSPLPLPLKKSNPSSIYSKRQFMTCGICMESFRSMSQISVHFKLVHPSFVCRICNYKFSKEASLKVHLRTHV